MARKAAATTGEKPKARKGSKTTLSEANLADLGPERLAAILLDLSSDSHVKRVLRLELFAESSAEGLALEISKRLATIGKSSSRIHWRKRAAFAKDLDLHRRMIERLAADEPTAALDLMLDLLDLATPTLDRLSQAEGPIGDVFLAAPGMENFPEGLRGRGAAGAAEGQARAQGGHRHPLAQTLPLRQLLLQIAQLRFAFGAGALAVALVGAFSRHVGDIVFIGDLLADLLEDLAFLFAQHDSRLL